MGTGYNAVIDITDRYVGMIESFQCDFSLNLSDPLKYPLCAIQQSERLRKDVKLLEELSYGLRNGMFKLVLTE